MKKIILISIAILSSQTLLAFPVRVGQIPNGAKFQCQNCHLTPGGPLNPFGNQVSNIGIVNGNVDWSLLYDEDADEDGFTNGEELGDPNGEWSIGDPNPGDEDLVTRPWDVNDFPSSVNPDNYFSDINVFGNPLIESSKIEFFTKQSGFLDVSLVNTNGEVVKNISYEYSSPSQKSIIITNRDDFGNSISSGMYFLRVRQEDAQKFVKILIQ